MTLVLAVVIFLAFVTETALGFGATLVTVTIGVFFAPLDVILPAFVPLNVLLSSYLLYRYRGFVDRPLLFRFILPMMGLGMPLGMWLFHSGGELTLRTLFGAFVAILSGIELVGMRGRVPARTRRFPSWLRRGLLIGGGIAHGAWASGGPLAVYVVGRDLADKRVFRATLAAIWLALNVVLVASYVVAGDIDGASLHRSGLLFFPLVVGIVAGEQVHARVDPVLFGRLVFALLLCAGVTIALGG